MKIKLLLLVLILLFSFLCCYSAENKIAVFDLHAKTDAISKDEILTLSDYIRSSFIQTGIYEVITRNQLKEIIDEYKFQMTGLSEGSDAIRLGNILNIKYAVVGTVGKFGNTYIINIQILNLETGKYLNADSITADSMDNALKQVKGKVNSIANSMLNTDEGKNLHIKYQPIIIKNNQIISIDSRLKNGWNPFSDLYPFLVRTISELPDVSPLLQNEINNYYNKVTWGWVLNISGLVVGTSSIFGIVYLLSLKDNNNILNNNTKEIYDNYGFLFWTCAILGLSTSIFGITMIYSEPIEVFNTFNEEYTIKRNIITNSYYSFNDNICFDILTLKITF